VGFQGNGTLTISDGGTVVAGRGMAIAIQSGTAGVVTVDGGSLTTHGLSIGDAGSGTLAISHGGTVMSHGFGPAIGQDAGGTGTVTVDGLNSSWQIDSSLEIGAGDNVGGTGSLTITNGGVVTAQSAVVGNLTGSTGTLIVDGPNSKFTTSDDIIIGQLGSGTATISNGGSVTASSVSIAGVAGSSGTLNIGAAAGSAPVAPGTLNTASVSFGAGDGVINFNHTSANYTFDAAISGAGTINQLAGTTFLSADSSGFQGPTNISGGALHVNGSLAGSDVTVTSGGTLAGSGIVGSVTVQSGGIVAPGNPIRTLTVANNVVFASGSIYQVQVNAAGDGDRVFAGGTANVSGGTVQVLAAAGNYSSSQSYTILSATLGVINTFAGVTSNLAFLTPSLTYNNNNVNLVLTRNSTSFASVGVTPNQIAAAGGVESLGAGNAVNNAVLNLSASQARDAFDQLSGEVHASAKTALIEDSRFVRDAAINRLRSAFGGVGASAGPLAAYAADGKPVAVAATTDGLAFWGQGFGSFGSTNGDGNAAKLSRSTGGFLAGGDVAAFDGARIGALGGYSRTNFDVTERGSSGTSDNYHFGLYGGSQWGALGFRSGAAYTWHQIATSRSVVVPGLGEQLSSGYAAGTAQVFGDLGYRIDAGHTAVGALAFEPFANLAYVNLWTGGFSETTGAAALTGRSGTTDVSYSTLGLRAATDFSLNGMAATARGSLGWRHAAGDVTPTSLLAFAGGGSAFSILGVPIAQDSAVVEAGFDVLVARNVSVGFSYVGQAASHAQDHDFKANMIWKF
jgi:outer membrane autotransporter protein